MAIGIHPDALAWGRRAIAHELTHVVTDQVVFNCLSNIPTWLSEGLATYNEHASAQPQSDYTRALEDAVADDELLSVRSIGGSFPTSQEGAVLAYGESFSLVQYLRERYGAEKLGALLSAFQAGSATDAALQQVYDFDQRGLEVEWRSHIGAARLGEDLLSQTPTPLAPAIPTFEPFSLATATPTAPEPLPVPTSTPTGQPYPGGGCNIGLPVDANAGGSDPATALLPLAPLALAGVALHIRRKRR